MVNVLDYSTQLLCYLAQSAVVYLMQMVELLKHCCQAIHAICEVFHFVLTVATDQVLKGRCAAHHVK